MTTPKDWMHEASAMIEGRIERFLQSKRERAMSVAPESLVLVDAIRDMTMRSAKRLRPLLVAASYKAVSPDSGFDAIGDAVLAAELLQTYMLIHDDWMDMDEMRRGKPTIHVLMTERYGDAHLGASVAILAGNLACSYAWGLLASSDLPPAKIRAVVQAFWEMQEDVVAGQLLDLVGHKDTDLVHVLKTASYTVNGPLQIGAMLGGGSDAQIEAFRRFGRLVGRAFQLRDDILGLYGDAKVTGKPVGNDIRAGRHTALIQEAACTLEGGRRAVLERALGNKRVTDAELDAVRALLEEAGVRARVEAIAQNHLAQAIATLNAAPFSPEGIEIVATLATLAVNRQR